MGFLIEINSGETSPDEWNALAALVHVMGGRIPAVCVKYDLGGKDVHSGPAVSGYVQHMAEQLGLPTDFLTGSVPEVSAAMLPSEQLMAEAAAAFSPPEQVPAPPPPGVTVDTAGLPWDARIHASTKTTTKDGKWTSKRNLDEALRKAVETELRALMAIPAPATPDAAVPPPPPPPPSPPVDDPAAAFPPPPVTDPVPASAFAEMMKTVLARQSAGTLNSDMVAATALQLGLTGIKDLAARPDLIPAFLAMLPAV